MQRKMISLLACLLAAALAAPGTAATAEAGPKPAERKLLERQVGIWAQGLAARPGFERFAAARAKIEPLGPGTHGWLVLLEDENGAVGYMVVHAVREGGFALTEYGLGEAPLYSAELLRRGLARLGLMKDIGESPPAVERRYAHPLGAAWRVETDDGVFYLDAKTGEELPADDQSWSGAEPEAAACLEERLPGGAQPSGRLKRHAEAATFDPYGRFPWITREPLAWADADIPALLGAGSELRLVAERFGGAFLYVLPVVAWHEWDDGTAYIGVDQEGLRFMPVSCLEPAARLYD
jgi:hypothetical protein